MSANYRLDAAAFREEVLNADWMVAEMDARAQRGYEHAESIAPERTGEYKSSFAIVSGKHGGVHHDRAYAELINVAEDAGFVEFGNGHDEGDHVLLRSMDAMK